MSAPPTVCIPSPPPDLDCGDIPYRRLKVLQPDPHRFDGDKDVVLAARASSRVRRGVQPHPHHRITHTQPVMGGLPTAHNHAVVQIPLVAWKPDRGKSYDGELSSGNPEIVLVDSRTVSSRYQSHPSK